MVLGSFAISIIIDSFAKIIIIMNNIMETNDPAKSRRAMIWYVVAQICVTLVCATLLILNLSDSFANPLKSSGAVLGFSAVICIWGVRELSYVSRFTRLLFILSSIAALATSLASLIIYINME